MSHLLGKGPEGQDRPVIGQQFKQQIWRRNKQQSEQQLGQQIMQQTTDFT